MNTYIGVSGYARTASNLYVGVNGQARKVTKGYIGVNGQARLFYNGDGGISWNNVFSPSFLSYATPVNNTWVYPEPTEVPMAFTSSNIAFFTTEYLYYDNYFGIWGDYHPLYDQYGLIGPFFAPVSNAGYSPGMITPPNMNALRDIWFNNGNGYYGVAWVSEGVMDMDKVYTLGDLVYIAAINDDNMRSGVFEVQLYVYPHGDTAEMEIRQNYVAIPTSYAEYLPPRVL